MKYSKENMSRKLTKEQDAFIIGGILAVLGLYSIISSHDLQSVQSGFLILGIGIVFMASTSKERSKQVFDFFLSIFKGLWKWLSHSD